VSDSESEEPRGGLGRAWSTLRIPHYRPFFFANFAQFLFSQVSMMAMYWLMTELTDKRFYITLVGFFQGATIFLLSPWGGVIADRVAKKWLLIGGRLGMVALVAVMGALVAADVAVIAHLWIGSLVGGVIISLMQPASQTFVFDLVGRSRLESAVALNATAGGIAQVVGPAAGGMIVAAIGVSSSFFLSGAGMFMAAGLLLAVPVAGRVATQVERKHPIQEIRDGFVWVWNDHGVRLVLFVSCMALFNGAIFSMRPVYARYVLDVGPEGLGIMSGANGIGTVLTAVAMAMLPRFRYVGLWITGGMLGFAICLVAYAFAFSLEYLLLVEFLLGVTGQVWNVTVMTGLQLSVPEHMRGRVISMVFMVAQLGFVGQPIVGALADAFGDRMALALFGLIPSAILIALLLTRRRVLMQVGEPA
jgi:MFS family permease